MFDQKAELTKARIMLSAMVAFLISACFSYQEFQYALFGKTTTATLLRAFETYDLSRHGRRIPKRGLKYRFTTSDGEYYERTVFVKMNYPVPQNGVIEVEYRAGRPDVSRVYGTHNTRSLVVFGCCVLWLGYSGLRLYKEAKRTLPNPNRRRQRARRQRGTAKDDHRNYRRKRTREARSEWSG